MHGTYWEHPWFDPSKGPVVQVNPSLPPIGLYAVMFITFLSYNEDVLIKRTKTAATRLENVSLNLNFSK